MSMLYSDSVRCNNHYSFSLSAKFFFEVQRHFYEKMKFRSPGLVLEFGPMNHLRPSNLTIMPSLLVWTLFELMAFILECHSDAEINKKMRFHLRKRGMGPDQIDLVILCFETLTLDYRTNNVKGRE